MTYLSRPAAGLAALLLSTAPVLLVTTASAAEDRTKAQIEHEEQSTTPNKAQIEHRESRRSSGVTTTREAPVSPAQHGERNAAAWQLALSAALGATLAGGVMAAGRQVSHHRGAIPA